VDELVSGMVRRVDYKVTPTFSTFIGGRASWLSRCHKFHGGEVFDRGLLSIEASLLSLDQSIGSQNGFFDKPMYIGRQYRIQILLSF